MKKLILFTLFTILITNILFIKTMNKNNNINSSQKLLSAIIINKPQDEEKVLEIIEEALDEGADINYTPKRRSNSATTLMLAINKEFNKIVLFLLEHPSINVNAVNFMDNNYTALMYAIRSSYDIDVIKMLLAKGARVDAQSCHGQNILNIVDLKIYTKTCRKTLINLLLKYAKKQIPNQLSEFVNNKCHYNYTTILNEEVAYGDVSIVKKLLEAGADPSITDYKGQTAYDLAKSLSTCNKANYDSEYKNDILAIIKLLDKHKQKINLQLKNSKIFGECNLQGIETIISDYII